MWIWDEYLGSSMAGLVMSLIRDLGSNKSEFQFKLCGCLLSVRLS